MEYILELGHCRRNVLLAFLMVQAMVLNASCIREMPSGSGVGQLNVYAHSFLDGYQEWGEQQYVFFGWESIAGARAYFLDITNHATGEKLEANTRNQFNISLLDQGWYRAQAFADMGDGNLIEISEIVMFDTRKLGLAPGVCVQEAIMRVDKTVDEPLHITAGERIYMGAGFVFKSSEVGSLKLEINQGLCSGNTEALPAAPGNTQTLNRLVSFNINKNEVQELRPYPNPFQDKFFIDLLGEQEVVTVRVLDPTGRLIEQPGNATGQQLSIDLTGKAAGVYIVQIIHSNGFSETKKVYKTR